MACTFLAIDFTDGVSLPNVDSKIHTYENIQFAVIKGYKTE